MCINSHDLDDCRNFNGVEVEGRSKFLSNQKLWVLQKYLNHILLQLSNSKNLQDICVDKHQIDLHGSKVKKRGDNSASNDDKTS